MDEAGKSPTIVSYLRYLEPININVHGGVLPTKMPRCYRSTVLRCVSRGEMGRNIALLTTFLDARDV